MKGTAILFALGLAVPAGAQTVPPAPADLVALQIVTMLPFAVDPVAELIAVHRDRTSAVHRCPTAPSDEIVVCGNRPGKNARQRLPLPEEAISEDDGSIVRGELPRASAKLVKQGRCAVIQDSIACNRTLYTRRQGVSLLEKLTHKLMDPDIDVEAPGFLDKLIAQDNGH